MIIELHQRRATKKPAMKLVIALICLAVPVIGNTWS
jgi:hypothetical protein